MHPLGHDLTQEAPAILGRWGALVTAPPFANRDDDVGELPGVLAGVIEASVVHPERADAHERHVQAAVRHGERRRAQGAEERTIWREFEALREAVRGHLLARPLAPALRREAQIRLDMAVSVAEMAAIRGYHRALLEQTGAWDELVPNMARQSPLRDLPALE